MREILFRGKRIDNDEWVYGSFCMDAVEQKNGPCGVDGFIRLYDFDKGKMQMHEVDRDTVGQYTGLTDKNGQKIFEGDIVVCRKEISGNWIDYCVEIGFVEMKHGAFGLHRKQGYYRPFKDWLEDYEYEVIGNIHDNPELLERRGD